MQSIEIVKKIVSKRGFKVNLEKLTSGYEDAFNKIETSLDIELQWLADRCGTYTVYHPDWSYLGAAILNKKLKRQRLSNYLDFIKDCQTKTLSKNGKNFFNVDFIEKVEKFQHLLELINHDNNQKLDYFGYTTLTKGYLIKHEDLYESPQEMYMRVAIFLGETEQDIIELYTILSEQKATFATPTMMSAGLNNGQLASCFLIQNYGDSIEDLMDVCSDAAIISKNVGGIGIAVSNVRASGSGVGGKGVSGGLMPMLKTHNELIRWFNQLGKRPGAMAEYLETWHKDILTFINIRRPSGKEEHRARDLFTALWVSDLFMERVRDDQKMVLFCPDAIKKAGRKDLQELYGEEFNKEYTILEDMYRKGLIDGEEISAREIWLAQITSQIETGTPYILFKDKINTLNMQNNLGVIKSSNLCAEIVEFSDSENIASCNLASIVISYFVKKDGTYDWEGLKNTVKEVVFALDNVIEKNKYPVKKTIHLNKSSRPVGIGVQGFADALVKMGMSFEDDVKSVEFNKEFFEKLQYFALQASMELAKIKGSYDSFYSSDYAKGIFHFEKAGVSVDDTHLKEKWNDLREDIKTYGLRNSLLIALMPTASTSQITANNECFEPFTSNVYARNVGSNSFIVINKHLVYELESIGAWNEGVSDWLITNNGSVNGLVNFLWENNYRTNDWEFVENIEKKYKTAFEISNKTIIDLASDRTPFVCQSQSMNLFIENPTASKVSSMLLYSWKKGLKTGLYYLRSKPFSTANSKLGMDTNNKKEGVPLFSNESNMVCSNEPDCVACSA